MQWSTSEKQLGLPPHCIVSPCCWRRQPTTRTTVCEYIHSLLYIYIYKRLCMYSQTVVLVVGCLRQQQGETMQCGGRPSCFSEVLHCIRLGFYGANCTTSWLLFLMSEWLFCAPGNHRMVVTPTLAVSVLTQGFGLAGLSGTRECLNEGKLACIVL